jgi:hypothetical protein
VGLLVIPGYLANTTAEKELISEVTHQAVVVHCLEDAHYDAAHLSCVLHHGAGPTVALVGDSHADMWIPPLLKLARRHDWTLIKTTHPGCPANDVHQAFEDRETECATWRYQALPELIDGGPDSPTPLHGETRPRRAALGRVSPSDPTARNRPGRLGFRLAAGAGTGRPPGCGSRRG